MPSLEDTPKLVTKTSPAAADLVPIHDVSEVGHGRTKKATLTQIASAGVAGFTPAANDSEAAAYGVPVGGPYVNSTTFVVTIRSV